MRDCYDLQMGRPGIDPEPAVRLMIAGLFQGTTRDRQLMRDGQVNLAIRWFVGYRLHEKFPHHSSLTQIRQRWGEHRFKKIFLKSVQDCVNAGLVDGETVPIDASRVRADVSWESLAERHVDQVLKDNEDDTPEARRRGGPKSRTKKPKRYSPTDPEGTMTTSCKQYRMEPCYKQHTVVDDRAEVIVDVVVTMGEASEGRQLPAQY